MKGCDLARHFIPKKIRLKANKGINHAENHRTAVYEVGCMKMNKANGKNDR